MEVWKDVVGYEGHYQVSNLGNVRSVKNNNIKMLTPKDNGVGYMKVNLRNNGNDKYAFVHRLVATAFLQEDPTRLFVNHINSIKGDNRVDNLEWVTKSENGKHAFRSGKLKILESQKASSEKISKPICDLNTGVFYNSLVDFQETYGLTRKVASNRIHKPSGYYSRFSISK